ncbi:hypothetical protein CsSME_00011633 [Camellia sinensis var. sinensis]
MYKSRNKIVRCWLRYTIKLQGSRIKDLKCLNDKHLGLDGTHLGPSDAHLGLDDAHFSQDAKVKMEISQNGSKMTRMRVVIHVVSLDQPIIFPLYK